MKLSPSRLASEVGPPDGPLAALKEMTKRLLRRDLPESPTRLVCSETPPYDRGHPSFLKGA